MSTSTTEALGSDSRARLVRKFHLHVIEGDDAGKRWTSSGTRAVIGGHESCDLLLTDPTVSRFHCEITIEDGRPLLRDLGSRNGTRIGSVEVIGARLEDGAVLGMGRTRVRFDLDASHVPIALSERQSFGGLVGQSAVMRSTFSMLERAAASNMTILLTGETGTGKEIAAESIHNESARREGPFVIVDCGAIPPTLLESELFGHVKGAFTGATGVREGAFEAAHGGTIFLDEIGELELELQPKLLRALEGRQVKRVGADRYEPVDVRVIAATNRDLKVEVNEKRFRSDLYFRLAVLEIRLPALRERLDDLPALTEHLLRSIGSPRAEQSVQPSRAELLAHLAQQPWVGNVRELRNYLERCLVLGDLPPAQPRSPSNEPPPLDLTQPLRPAREAWTRVFEHRYLSALLRHHGDNVSAAARAAQIDRNYFYRLLWKHGLR